MGFDGPVSQWSAHMGCGSETAKTFMIQYTISITEIPNMIFRGIQMTFYCLLFEFQGASKARSFCTHQMTLESKKNIKLTKWT